MKYEKMNKILLVSFLVLSTMFPSFSYANRITTQTIKDYCVSYYNDNTNESMMYILGIINQEEVYSALSPDKNKLFCIPEDMTYGQINDVVCHDIFVNPETLNHSVPLVVDAILNKHFPCK